MHRLEPQEWLVVVQAKGLDDLNVFWIVPELVEELIDHLQRWVVVVKFEMHVLVANT